MTTATTDPTLAHEAFAGNERFAVLEQLGAGSMCVVYGVRDLQHGDVVALKTLKHLDANSLYRLKQEFRALSSFDHPNLVSFYELVRTGEGWFVTMELVEGTDFLTHVRGEEDGARSRERTRSTSMQTQPSEDLRFHGSAPAGSAITRENATTAAFLPELPGGPADLLKLRSCLRQVSEGVAYLHAAGRVHRDLKPSNVLVTGAGRVVILDFGLVAEIDQDYTEGTLHQNIAGSAAYMSPEQSVGRKLSVASDWYSVGVMLYEALTGVWPYVGHLYQILTAKQQEDPRPPSQVLDGVPPDLDDLCMLLLARDPALRPDGAEVIARMKGAPPGVAHRSLRARFQFRETHLHELVKAFQTAKWGRTVVTLVRGGPGMGKTTLVREFVKSTNRREAMTTLKGRCYEWETVPYKGLDAVIDNLSRVLRRFDGVSLMSLSSEDLPYLASLFPVLQRADLLLDLGSPPEAVLPDELRRRAFSGLRVLLRQLCAQRPLLLYIDDVHWGDTESAQVLGELIRAEPSLALHLVLSYRADEPAAFIHWLLPVLQRSSVDIRTVDLEPLAFDDACTLASELLLKGAEEPEVRRVALESGGVPAVLQELCRSLVLRGGQRSAQPMFNEVTVAQLDGLDGPTMRLLEFLAVAGQPVDTDFAIRVCELGDAAFAALSTLRALEIVDVQSGSEGGVLELVGDGIRDYVYDRTPEDRRARHHLAIAHALELAQVDDVDALVHHYASAGDTAKAGLVAWLGAQRSLQEQRHDMSAWLLDRALALGEWSARERRSMYALLGDALALVGRGEAAARAYERSVEEGVPVTTRRTRLHKAAQQLIACGLIDEGYARLDALLKSVRMPSLDGTLGGTAAWRGLRLWWRGRDFQPKRPEQVDPERLLRVDLSWTACCALALVDPYRGARYHRVHLFEALEVGEEERVVRACAAELPRLAAEDGDGRRWRVAYEGVLEHARRVGTSTSMGRLLSAAARAAFLEGRFVEAGEQALEAIALLDSHTSDAVGWERYEVKLVRLRSLLAQGELKLAAEFLGGMEASEEESENLLYHTDIVSVGRAPLRLAGDEPDTCAAELARAIEAWSHAGPHIQHVRLLRARVLLDIYRDRPSAGWERLQRWQKPLRRSGLLTDPSIRDDLELVRGRCALALARVDVDRSARLRDATRIGRQLLRSRGTWAHPYGCLLLAGVEAISGADCRSNLEAARDDFARGDMWLGAAAAGRQLAILEGAQSIDALTRAERWMQDQGVRNVPQLCKVIAPGF